jgi:hypothetical protein
MRRLSDCLSKMVLMAAIVATLLFLPVGALLAFLCFGLLGISLHAFVTFGGTLSVFQGLLAWWILDFVPALAYAAYALPWEQSDW